MEEQLAILSEKEGGCATEEKQSLIAVAVIVGWIWASEIW